MTVLSVHPVSIGALISTLEALAGHPRSNIRETAAFAGQAVRTTERAIGSLRALELVSQIEDGRLLCTAQNVRRGSERNVLQQIVRRALIRYRPFEAMCQGLSLGEPKEVAIVRASLLIGAPGSQASKFEILIRWGIELEILSRVESELRVALDTDFGALSTDPEPIITAKDVESEISARLYLGRGMGRDAFDSVDEDERTLLTQALVTYSKDPAGAVEKAGQMMENYLRVLADTRGFRDEARKVNGAGQLANLLVSKNVMHSHQQKLVDVVGTLRNAKVHDKDKKTLMPWEISSHAAFVAVMTTIGAVRSIHEFTTNNKQIL